MFNVFDKIKPQSIDLLLTDFPYGTLNKRNTWDTIIDYDKFWKYVDIICKPNSTYYINCTTTIHNKTYIYKL